MRLTTATGAGLLLSAGLQCLIHPALAAPATPPVSPAPPAPTEMVIEEGTKTALKEMSDYLRTAKSYSFHASIQFDDVLPTGQKITFGAESEVSLRRPNGIHARQISDTGAKRLWFDGKALTLLDPVKLSYAVDAVSGNTDQALEHMINVLHFTPPLSDFLYEDPAKALTKNTRFGFAVGGSEVGGVACRHYAFVDQLIDWQLWIEDGKAPLPRKIMITYKTLPSSPQFVATLSDWDFTTRLPDSLFQAEIPAGAIKIPFMKEGQAAWPDSVVKKNSPQ